MQVNDFRQSIDGASDQRSESDGDSEEISNSNSNSDRLEIHVIDTGIGIAPEYINKLFKPFMQIDSALNRRYDGTGLGLALVKQLVELHGGQVHVTSEVGVGSCFKIVLPAHPLT